MHFPFFVVTLFALFFEASATSSGYTVLHKEVVVPAGWVLDDTERIDPLLPLRVTIGLSRGDVGELQRCVRDVSDPDSDKYQMYPNETELNAMVRAPEENIASVVSWLRSHNVSSIDIHRHRDSLSFTAFPAQIQSLSQARFLRYKNKNGRFIHRITSAVVVPTHVAKIIDVIGGVHGFPLERAFRSEASCAGCVVTPEVLRTVYNISAVSKGGKINVNAIAQFQGQFVSPKDLREFCSSYDDGANCSIARYIGEDDPTSPGDESMLDTEYIVPLGNTTTWVYSVRNNDFCADLISFAANVTSESHPTTISISYGTQLIGFCDDALVKRFAEDVQKMATMGITLVIASGDDGSGHITRQGTNPGSLSPAYPASIPYCVAVGSTYFVEGTGGAEQASTEFGSGGGFSQNFALPDYQSTQVSGYMTTVDLPKDYSYANGRGTPDVAMLGQAYTMRVRGVDVSVGGTSASAPVFAAVVTLLNEACLAEGGNTLGHANPLLYANPKMFQDVTLGTNAIGANTEGWAATAGWDAATGLGTPNVGEMLGVVRTLCKKVAKKKRERGY